MISFETALYNTIYLTCKIMRIYYYFRLVSKIKKHPTFSYANHCAAHVFPFLEDSLLLLELIEQLAEISIAGRTRLFAVVIRLVLCRGSSGGCGSVGILRIIRCRRS